MLVRTLEQDTLSHKVLQDVYDDKGLSDKDLAFIKRLYSGTLEKLVYLDYVLDRYSKLPVRKMKPVIRNILRMSVYQLRFMDSVPAYTCINEAVKLTRKRGFHNLTGFVNGVLRKVDREAEGLELPDNIRACAPKWIYDLIAAQYGKETADAFFQAVQDSPNETHIRICSHHGCLAESISVNNLNEDRNTHCKGFNKNFSGNSNDSVDINLSDNSDFSRVIESLKRDGCTVCPLPPVDGAYAISGFRRLSSLKAFRNGDIIIQDPSSILAAQAALIDHLQYEDHPDQPMTGLGPPLIVDVCAAPGGKSLYIAQECPDARIIARDLTESKAEKIRENMDRLHISNIEVQVFDARKEDSSLKDKADVVVADLPCSGLGVIAGKPDILYRLKEEDLESLAELQRQILGTVQAYVKKGGILVYSTCTVNKGENHDNTRWFLEHYPFELLEEQQFLPGRDPYDGFYIARFRKNGLPDLTCKTK